jgi:hypothetical protein
VDAIYPDHAGGALVIEHTAIEPFEGALSYEHGSLKAIWEPLKRLPLPERDIWLRVGRLETEKSRSWPQDGSLVKEWFLKERQNFPLAGAEAPYEIPRPLDPPFCVYVWTQRISDPHGMVSITSWDPKLKLAEPSQSFIPRVKKAIEDKLPKLCGDKRFMLPDQRIVLVDRRILLLELVDRSLFSLWELAKVIETLSPCFPDLDKVEVWATDNSRFDIPGTPSFCHLQGGQIGHTFLTTRVVAMIPPIV